jgi:hypothetical protein
MKRCESMIGKSGLFDTALCMGRFFKKSTNTHPYKADYFRHQVGTTNSADSYELCNNCDSAMQSPQRAPGVAKQRAGAAISEPCRIRHSFADTITTSSKTSQIFVGRISYEQRFLIVSTVFRALFHLLLLLPRDISYRTNPNEA